MRRYYRDRAWNFIRDDYVVHTRGNGIKAGGSLGKSERKGKNNYGKENGEMTN